MQVVYKKFLYDVSEEARRAAQACIAKADQPGFEDRQGYFEALASASTLVRFFFCKDRAFFDSEPVIRLFEDEIDRCISLVHDYYYSWDQHYEFARARGYLVAIRLLRAYGVKCAPQFTVDLGGDVV